MKTLSDEELNYLAKVIKDDFPTNEPLYQRLLGELARRHAYANQDSFDSIFIRTLTKNMTMLDALQMEIL